MNDPVAHLTLLMDLDARHDAVLDELDALEARVAQALAECLALREMNAHGGSARL